MSQEGFISTYNNSIFEWSVKTNLMNATKSQGEINKKSIVTCNSQFHFLTQDKIDETQRLPDQKYMHQYYPQSKTSYWFNISTESKLVNIARLKEIPNRKNLERILQLTNLDVVIQLNAFSKHVCIRSQNFHPIKVSVIVYKRYNVL